MSISLKNSFAPAVAVERGRPAVVGGDLKNKKQMSYGSGRTAILRDLSDPLKVFIYQGEHKSNVTCVKISPTGYYVASADANSNIIIWDPIGEDHTTKLEKQTIGVINDIAWTEDGKRVIAVGKGATVMGDAFFMDGGASCGDITGHLGPLLTVDIKQNRPYRAATGGEDMSVGWFEGPPFKPKKKMTEHQRYVNCVRYSPDGSKLVTVGADKKGFIYDGKTGDKLLEFDAGDSHKGGIYGASWSPDSSKILTASADKTCKIWDAASGKVLTTFTLGTELDDQQLGCLWQGENLVSINLRGSISYLDEGNPSQPKKVQHGHNKPIVALATDRANGGFFTADTSGYVVSWRASDGSTELFSGKGHETQIKDMACANGTLITIALDDTIRFNKISPASYGDSIQLPGQPQRVSSNGTITVVACVEHVVIFNGDKLASKHEFKYGPVAIAVNKGGDEVAVGGRDNKVYVYSLAGNTLTQKHVHEGLTGVCVALDYSDDGKLASADAGRYVRAWNGTTEVSKNWIRHTSRCEYVAWSPNNDLVASAGSDSAIFVWSVSQPDTIIKNPGSHVGGVKSLGWLDDNTLVSAGQDQTAKSWTVSL